MEISKLFVQARSATVQIADGGLYHTKAVYQLFLNGQAAGTADTAGGRETERKTSSLIKTAQTEF